MIFFSKAREVHELLRSYIEKVDECHNEYCDFISRFIENDCNGIDDCEGKAIDILESEADDKRHEIIKSLLKGAMLPESRREILKLIEQIDEIPNDEEEISRQIINQKIKFPEEIKENILGINEKTTAQFKLLCKLVDSLFTGQKDKGLDFEEINRIEKMETEIDVLENETIKTIYNMNIELAEKNQLDNIVSKIADVSDIIEDISDMIEIILVMRKV
jgi:predicted phosphate transport protein (TIGR00153 family)